MRTNRSIPPLPPILFSLALLLLPQAQAQGLEGLTRWEGGRSRRASSGVHVEGDPRHPDNNKDRLDRIEPGKTFVLADLKGPGVITHIWLTFLHEPHRWAEDGAANHQEMLLRIFWDGRPHPDVEAPLGEFFASCFGRRMQVISAPVVVEDGDSYNCFWRMPFREAARIEIVNQSAKPIRKLYYNIDWIEKDSLPADALYFCAQYRQEYPARKGADYLVLEAEGKGHYVGTVLAVRTRSPSWWGEGDEKICIDGEPSPSIRGTGTEDYFLSAWALKPNLTPCSGTPFLSSPERFIGQKTCCYRWHIHDPIVFSKGIRVAFETFGWISPDENPDYRAVSWNERQDDLCSVAFWYQEGPAKRFADVPPAAERRLPPLERVLLWGKSALEGPRGKGAARLQQGADYLESGGQLLFEPAALSEGWLEYAFEIAAKEPLRLSLELTRSYDYGRYRVLLNGVQIGAPLDLYRPERELREFQLMDFWPEPGKYTLRLECVGRNPASGGLRLGVNAIRLLERRPLVRELGHEENKDWRVEQVLHK